MDTTVQVLSHACMLIKRGDNSVIIDPWLVGACYWGSWWNYPPAHINENDLSQVKNVVISHVHWDHWHGLSLKKYFKGCQYIISDEPNTRSLDDLKQCKLGNITTAAHGKTIQLENDIKITLYQFGLFLNDAAIVIETPEVKILNANDAKISGKPLSYIMKKHGKFDFAFKSHSTANYRACITIEDNSTTSADDNNHYVRSFKAFMDAVKPKYAIPFASNSCHLHKDTFKFNQFVTNPMILKEYLNNYPLTDSELQILLPGDSWSSIAGFTIQDSRPYENINEKLQQYANNIKNTLQNLYAKERKLLDLNSVLKKHMTHLSFIPKFLKKKLNNKSICYDVMTIDNEHSYMSINIRTNTFEKVTLKEFDAADIKFQWPAHVLQNSVLKNMYHHAFISKRVSFSIKHANMKYLKKYITLLELIELNVFPIRAKYIKTLVKCYYIRWRELIVYFLAAYYKFLKKKPTYLLDEIILKKHTK